MPTFQQLADHCYYLPGSVNVGLVTRQDGKAVLIDTGGDKEAGRAIRKGLEAASLTAVALAITGYKAISGPRFFGTDAKGGAA